MLLYYMLLVWTFFFGSVFGSFLNVVVWRLPLGMSLSYPASHCPKCGHPIRKRHNVPLFGWLLLRGRCYDCKSPISARYPLVEFLAGMGFTVFFAPLWLAWSQNPDFPVPLFRVMFLARAADCALFLTTLAAGLILRDRNRVPKRLFLTAAVLIPAAFAAEQLLFTHYSEIQPLSAVISALFLALAFILSRFSGLRGPLGASVLFFLAVIPMLPFFVRVFQ